MYVHIFLECIYFNNMFMKIIINMCVFLWLSRYSDDLSISLFVRHGFLIRYLTKKSKVIKICVKNELLFNVCQ